MPEQIATATKKTTYRSTHRFIRERWVIKGALVLETPAHFGSGESSYFTDMPLILDENTGTPLLPGTSIAGALRNYLRECECGDGKPLPEFPNTVDVGSYEKAEAIFDELKANERNRFASLLFGTFRGDDEGLQSPLVVYDAHATGHGDEGFHFELRDGVRIDQKTRTAADDMKYDVELLAAGTRFPLQFELMVGLREKPKSDDTEALQTAQFEADREKLLTALATALAGFSQGKIKLGGRKTRGYGECKVEEWNIQHYDLTTQNGLLGWLVSEREDDWLPNAPEAQKHSGTSIVEVINAFKVSKNPVQVIKDQRRRATLTATFSLDGSLLIRSGFGEDDLGPDAMHLHSLRGQEKKPIIPGTSWAGVLRHRAAQIARTVAAGNDQKANKFIDDLFGPAEITHETIHTHASRLSVRETVITGEFEGSLVQTRVKIDRFTGGAFETALFSEQPIFGHDKTGITLEITLKPPPRTDPRKSDSETIRESEVGLLLLLLKDLWTSDLPIGGEVSVGRGRLRGESAILQMDDGKEWQFIRKGDYGVEIKGEHKDDLETFVNKFNQEIKADAGDQKSK